MKKILSFTAVLFFSFSMHCGQWNIESIESSYYWSNMGLQCDTNGLICRAEYYDRTIECFRFFNIGWVSAGTIATSPDGSNFEFHGGKWFVAGQNGFLHAVCEFWNYTTNKSILVYSRFDGSNWASEVVLSNQSDIYWYSLIVDQNNKPHVLYYNDSSMNYINKTAATWSTPVTGLSTNIYHSSVACNGNIPVYATSNYSSTINIFSLISGTWTNTGSIPLSGSDYINNLSMDIRNGKWVVAYSTGNNEDIKAALSENGTVWQTYDIDVGSEKMGTSNIAAAINSSGVPVISYNNASFDDLKCAVYSGGAWNVQTVDSAGKVGYYNSAAIDADGNTHIIYSDETNFKLKHAYWTGGLGGSVVATGPTHNIRIYGNVFKPGSGESMAVQCQLFQPGQLKISLYSLKNELVKVLVDEQKSEGNHAFNWNGTSSSGGGVASGVYYIVTEFGGARTVKKAAVIK